jgi:hypothetical protein
MSRMRAVGLGWDIGREGGDKTVYYCSVHGNLTEPCSCIDAYFKSQVREQELKRIGRSERHE